MTTWVFCEEQNGTASQSALELLTKARSLGGTVSAFIAGDGADVAAALGDHGLHLRRCPRVHLKTVVVDGSWMYLGSANLTGAGLEAQVTDGALLTKRLAEVVRRDGDRSSTVVRLGA